MAAAVPYDQVEHAIREVAATIVLPRFRQLTDGDVAEKGPGDLVTVADTEAEAALTRMLVGLLPGSTVVGEEAVAADPGVLGRAAAAPGGRVWVVDPIDGTRNFVAGSPHFGVMVALVEDGVTAASWIHHPATDRMFVAGRGAGATADGRPLVRAPAPAGDGALDLTVVTRLLDDATNARVQRRSTPLGRLHPNVGAACIQYPRVAEGELDAVLYWRTLVWDHAAGALLVEEAGGRVARLDGDDYEPWSDRTGLLLAADPATHARVRRHLAPDGRL